LWNVILIATYSGTTWTQSTKNSWRAQSPTKPSWTSASCPCSSHSYKMPVNLKLCKKRGTLRQQVGQIDACCSWSTASIGLGLSLAKAMCCLAANVCDWWVNMARRANPPVVGRWKWLSNGQTFLWLVGENGSLTANYFVVGRWKWLSYGQLFCGWSVKMALLRTTILCLVGENGSLTANYSVVGWWKWLS
jgi:hypothetical protein